MKLERIKTISIIGAVIAGLISIGNLVYILVLKAQELKAQGTDSFWNDLIKYAVDADYRETVYYKIAFGVLGAAFILHTISFIINADETGFKIGMIIVRTAQIVCAVIVTIVKHKTGAYFPALSVMIPGIVIAVAELVALLLYRAEDEHIASAITLGVSSLIVVLMNVVCVVMVIAAAFIILKMFSRIIEMITTGDFSMPKIEVFNSAGRHIGSVHENFIDKI